MTFHPKPRLEIDVVQDSAYPDLFRRRAFICAVFAGYLSFAGIALGADVQVNAPDHNATNLGNFTSESETNVAVSGSTVVVGYNSTKQAGLLGSGAWNSLSGYAFSLNGGTSFTDGGFVPSGTNKLIGDPALAFDRTGSTLYYVSIGTDAGGISRIFVNPSTSLNPVTFGPPVIVSGLLSGSGHFQDKEFVAVDTTGGPFDGRVYVAWSEFPTPGGPNAQVLVAASSTIDPLAFSGTIGLSPTTGVNHGAMPAVAANGDVYVVWALFASTTTPAAETIQIVKSTNGGKSFQNPDWSDLAPSKTVASVTSTAGNMTTAGINIRTRGFPYIAIDRTPLGSPTHGNIYVVFQAKPSTAARSAIFFVRSTDGGVTWSAPRSISDGPAVTIGGDPTTNDNWMPSITVSPVTGHIRVIFYSRREDVANTNIRVYDAGSTDGGLTWFNQPRSTVAFNPSTGYDPLLWANYMGDYLKVVANGSNYHAAWGDTRNTCAPPGGATAPCSPAGRGDQDVFYSNDVDPTGTDLAITPWGYTTGQGPLWQSPDIFVVDPGTGLPTNAKKLIVNQLRARVRNLGNAAANGATVRFRYAPIFVGLSDSQFEEIAAVPVNFSAAGGASALQDVPALWDLTNLSFNGGSGQWGSNTIGMFDHFCVRVTVEFSGDINQSNNFAQNNFSDVADACCGPLRFLIGNPFERDISARLEVTGLPKGYNVRIRGIDDQDGLVRLKFKELRTASLDITRPAQFEKQRRTQDVVAHVSMLVDNKPVGGLSVRLAKANVVMQPPRDVKPVVRVAQAQTQPTPRADTAPNTSVVLNLASDRALTLRAISAAFEQQKIPVVQVDAERGLISSGPVPLNATAMRSAIPAALFRDLKGATGRFYLSVKVDQEGQQNSRATVSARIILEKAELDSPIGGRVVPSNGSLEKRLADAVQQALQRLR
jgi:hypothetical protein